MDMLADIKECRKCGQALSSAELPGKRRVCAACKKADTALRAKKHYEKNKNEILARQKTLRSSLLAEEKGRRRQVYLDWRIRNAERVRAYWDNDQARAQRRKWYESPEVRARQKAAVARYFQKTPAEVLRWRSAQYARNNRPVMNARHARRRAAELQAVPSWANRDAIKQIYQDARDLTCVLGKEWHVDHIVPLRGHSVCGLHVEGNLQILESTLNKRKSNSFWPDMP